MSSKLPKKEKEVANMESWKKTKLLKISHDLIDTMDLFVVKKRVMKEFSFSSVYADKLIAQYRKMLKRVARGERVEPESKDMDEIWHAHVLFTMKYVQDCNRIFGHYLHHSPYA